MAEPLESRMLESMEDQVAEIERQQNELHRQRVFFHNQQRGSAFDQYGGYPQYGGGYGGGRGSYATAQRLMLDHQLRTTREQQKYDLWQQQEEYTAQSKTQEMQRKLDELAKQRDQVANNKLLGETQRQEYLQRIDDEAWEIKTGLGVDVPRIYERPSGYTTRDKDGNEMSVPMFYYYKQDGSVDVIDNGSGAWEQEKGRKAYEDAERKTAIAGKQYELEVKKEERMNRETAIKESAERREASGEASGKERQREKEAVLKTLKAERETKRKKWIEDEFSKWTEEQKRSGKTPTTDENNLKMMELDSQSMGKEEYKDTVPIPEINKRWQDLRLLREDPEDLTDEQLDKRVQYEQPEDAMYPEEDPLGMGASDEQFAQEGVFDPTSGDQYAYDPEQDIFSLGGYG